MKSAAYDLGMHRITVNAVILGLINMPLTRHEERYAQALQVDSKAPSRNQNADESAANAALAGKSPLGIP